MPPERTSRARPEPAPGPLAHPPAGTSPRWWLQAPEIFERIHRRRPSSTWGGAYRLGDALLEIDSDDRGVAESIREMFAECAVAESSDAGPMPRVRCTLRSQPDGEFATVDLEADEPLDTLDMVGGLLEPRPLARCFVRPSPLANWQLVGRKGASEPLMAVAPRRVLVRAADLARAPEAGPGFFRDLAAAAVLRVQSGVLFLHAASVCVAGAGVVLTGRGGSGKTTLALALASRGHGLLGDDLAALRQQSLELLPLRRTLHIRRGPRAALVEKALRERWVEMEARPASTPRALVQARELFSADPAAPSPLRAAFFLRAFRKRPALERFAPSLAQLEALRHLPVRLQWGITPARRLLRFAQAARCFARVPCFQLDVGRPEETADLIETTVEEL
jgi:hypothetical protein